MTDNELSNNELYSKLLDAIKQQGEKTERDIKKYIEIENSKLHTQINEQKQEVEKLQEKIESLESKYLNLERKVRKNNIVIFGLKVNPVDNIAQTVLDKLNELLGVKIDLKDINNIYKINTKKEVLTKIEFASYLIKEKVFSNIKRLKNTSIFIAHDLCYEDRVNQKILQKHKKIALEKNLSAKIVGSKLQIQGKYFTARQLESQNTQTEVVEVDSLHQAETRSNTVTTKHAEKETEELETKKKHKYQEQKAADKDGEKHCGSYSGRTRMKNTNQAYKQ